MWSSAEWSGGHQTRTFPEDCSRMSKLLKQLTDQNKRCGTESIPPGRPQMAGSCVKPYLARILDSGGLCREEMATKRHKKTQEIETSFCSSAPLCGYSLSFHGDTR